MPFCWLQYCPLSASPAGEENSGNELESGGVVTVLSDLVRVAHAQSTPEFHTKTTMQMSQASCVHKLVCSVESRTVQPFFLCYPEVDQAKTLCYADADHAETMVILTRIKLKTSSGCQRFFGRTLFQSEQHQCRYGRRFWRFLRHDVRNGL